MCVGLSPGMSTPKRRGIARNSSTLSLLVPRVTANDQELAVAAHQLAVLADALHARPNFHRRPRGQYRGYVRVFYPINRRRKWQRLPPRESEFPRRWG